MHHLSALAAACSPQNGRMEKYIVTLTPEEAEQLYVELPNKSVSYETAFPDVVVEEA